MASSDRYHSGGNAGESSNICDNVTLFANVGSSSDPSGKECIVAYSVVSLEDAIKRNLAVSAKGYMFALPFMSQNLDFDVPSKFAHYAPSSSLHCLLRVIVVQAAMHIPRYRKNSFDTIKLEEKKSFTTVPQNKPMLILRIDVLFEVNPLIER